MPAKHYELPGDWEDPEDFHQFVVHLREIRPKADVKRIRFAYYIAEKEHAGQVRQSGEPYIMHPLAVSRILSDLQMDDETIIAALLHDVVEDGDIGLEEIEGYFGRDVAELIDGVTKLKLQQQENLTSRQKKAAETNRTAETLRKMLLAMANDYRVMVIKLADRLHNMQTLHHMPTEKQLRIASETLDVYAPLAARLGIWQIKWQLEDLSFKYLHPREYHSVQERVASTRDAREREIAEVILAIKERVQARGVKIVDIRGRPKHLYSIYNKMVKQGIPFEEIYDLLALRIIVEDVSECYVVLGLVHEMFVPLMALFYDYIAKPKSNGYQSLHTKVLGPGGQPLEIQIRTRQMHEVAEFGVAAHWTYKEGKASEKEIGNFSNLRQQLFDWSSDARTSSDFLRSLSTDLFAEQVFVFTPNGDVLDLPLGSTPIDFAFRVHTQLGMKMVGAKINGVISPLSTKLQNGDVIEVVTRSNASPSWDWLEHVKSAHARSKIKAHFRKLSREQDAIKGKDALEKELRTLGLDPKHYLGEDRVDKLSHEFDGVENGQDLLAKVGSGLVSVQRVISKLRGSQPEQQSGQKIEVTKTREGKLQLTSEGFKGILLNRAKCCAPIPGDEIVGYVTRGRGIMIHRRICPHALDFAQNEPERLISFNWPADEKSVYSVTIKMVCVNRQGLLMEVSTIFGESKTNVSAASVKTSGNNTAEIIATLDVHDTQHLAAIMTKISNFSDVLTILRLDGRGH
ncbi:MAG: bifunctional (p)ppGpp synthetase/guanosine-3',5'-bis(diphosphate) 3'-pyrophosphohydrolase [Armatimonadetes bacterium]|nr:bifunctional (p)ppGpp synthetase/guanosine-3',5'-bis(diphosphate) 3'-pyrophosphohydrolase [Armatimonadota bacterium]